MEAAVVRNMHKDGSCECLGVAGASASFDRGTLELNEPTQADIWIYLHWQRKDFGRIMCTIAICVGRRFQW